MDPRNKHCLLSTVIVMITLLLTACGATTLANTPDICGETETVRAGEFAWPYTPENSGLESKNIRTLTMAQNGLWIGYAGGVGVGHFDGKHWRFCRETPHVNAIAIDENGHPWVGTDAPPGGPALLHYDGTVWTDYTQNLPDYRVYDLTWHDGNLYVGTWEGVAQFDGQDWTVPYNTQRNIFENHIHAVAFARNGDVGFFAIKGVSTWLHQGIWRPLVTPEMNMVTAVIGLATDQIREATEHPTEPEVWIAGEGGNVVVYDYEVDEWRQIATPNIQVSDLEFDHYGRAWIATAGGTFYYENDSWVPMPYDYPALSLAFGCKGCVFNQDKAFLATNGFGLMEVDVPQFTK